MVNMEKRVITKQHLKVLFEQMGVQCGSVVLLQADLSQMPALVGGISTVIETLCDIITPRGLLIVPSFTLQALDPANLPSCAYPVSQWETIRLEHPGFSSRSTPADQNAQAAAALLLHTKVKRSEHPVYSFAWWGSASCKPGIDDYNYPVSYKHILGRMEDENAMNIVLGMDIKQSLYPIMEARKRQEDLAVVQHAFIRKVRKTIEVPFLHSKLTEQTLKHVMTHFDVLEYDLKGLPVYKIMHPISLSSIFETDSISA